MEDELIDLELTYLNQSFTVTVDKGTYDIISSDQTKLDQYAEDVYKTYFVSDSAGKDKHSDQGECSRSLIEETTFRWTYNSTILLAQLRLDKEEEFNRPICKKKKLWNNIATEMNNNGYNVTGEMCDLKFRNLLATYKKNKKKKEQSGEGAIMWEFFEVFDRVLGTKASIVPPQETIGTIEGIVNEVESEISDINSHCEDEAITIKKQDSNIKGKKKKRVHNTITYSEYLQEKLKLDREFKEKKDKRENEKWKDKKEIKEREVRALESLAEALVTKYCSSKTN